MKNFFLNIPKLFKTAKFKFHRKTEDFPLKAMSYVLLGALVISLAEMYYFYSVPDIPVDIEIAEFENNILSNLNASKKKFIESCYIKKATTYVLKNKLTSQEKLRIISILKSIQYKDFSFFDSIWWTIVTITTVGYGDYSPTSTTGRSLAIVLMGIGIVFTSVLSGTIASIFVERKLREGRGMKELNIKDHIVICGWNDTADNLLKSLPLAGGNFNLSVVLMNELDEDSITDIKIRHKDLDIKFVKGDFTRDEVLKRGSVDKASSVIILGDISGDHTLNNADQRTIIAAFAIKNMASDVKIAAEINKKENEEHLKRANVDDILIYGEFGGFLLSHAAISPGVPALIMELLSFSVGNTITKARIPSYFIGKTFRELSGHYRNKRNSILIGVLTEEKDITLDDILSEESGGIDLFIKKKFSEVEGDYFGDDKPNFNVQVNPGDNYIIQEIDTAFIITKDHEES